MIRRPDGDRGSAGFDESLHELMDSPDAAPRDLRDAAEDLAVSNRWLGAHATTIATCAELVRVAARDGRRPVRVLDAAGGGGDTALALIRWAERARIPLAVTVLELSEPVAEVARECLADAASATVVLGDLRCPPESARGCDVVHAGQVLHHVPPSERAATIAHLASLARVGVAITDLRRERWAAVGVKLFGRLTRRRRFFLHDGPVSVLRSFTPAGARRLADESGVAGVRVRSHPLARISWTVGPLPHRPDRARHG